MTHSSSSLLHGTLASLLLFATLGACSGNLEPDGGSGGSSAGGAPLTGGGPGSGGSAAGGANSGGSGTGASSGGVNAGGGEAVGGAPAGGAPGTGGGAGYPATFETIRQIVANSLNVAEGCGSVSCHLGEATPHFTNNDSLHADLVDPTHISEYCGNIPLVTPGDPSKSAFFKAISEGCDTIEYMPNGCDPDPLYGNCLPAAAVDAVEAWILAGALEE